MHWNVARMHFLDLQQLDRWLNGWVYERYGSFHVTSRAFYVHTNWWFWCTAARYKTIKFILAFALMTLTLKYALVATYYT